MRKKFFIVTAALLMIGSYAADNFDMAGILSYASGTVKTGVSPELLVGVDKAPDDTDAEETEAASGIVNSSEDGWELLLVNRQHPIPENYEVKLTQLQNDQAVDERIYPALQEMFDDARAEGILPTISSSYRTAEKQQELMDEKIAEYQASGYDYETAKQLAEEWVAIPGTSEHQMGLSVDITTADWNQQDASVVWDWMMRNSYKYGFIQRYPENKTDITGIINEPWHYRYVGREAAQEIYEQGICLEEYLESK